MDKVQLTQGTQWGQGGRLLLTAKSPGVRGPHLIDARKDERLSQPWNYLLDSNPVPLNW